MNDKKSKTSTTRIIFRGIYLFSILAIYLRAVFSEDSSLNGENLFYAIAFITVFYLTFSSLMFDTEFSRYLSPVRDEDKEAVRAFFLILIIVASILSLIPGLGEYIIRAVFFVFFSFIISLLLIGIILFFLRPFFGD
ncbi:MAG: hypothetical protein RBR08_06220 [Desulforegulaceae bacterium]|nr:hypothetical protein [Desulforegulaceae bacterium]